MVSLSLPNPVIWKKISNINFNYDIPHGLIKKCTPYSSLGCSSDPYKVSWSQLLIWPPHVKIHSKTIPSFYSDSSNKVKCLLNVSWGPANLFKSYHIKVYLVKVKIINEIKFGVIHTYIMWAQLLSPTLHLHTYLLILWPLTLERRIIWTP